MKKKSIIRLLSLFLFVSAFLSANLIAEETFKEVKYKTTAHCDDCKNKIEGGLKKMEGIVKTELNLEDKVVTVQYNPEKISPNKIKKTINKLGYKTDVVSDDKPAVCPEMKKCQKTGCPLKK